MTCVPIPALGLHEGGKQGNDMPWITYTHISHTNSGKKDHATPLFDWGKFFEKDGRLLMPVSVQAHHSFVDGLHVGRFAERLQRFMEEYEVARSS